MICPCILDVHLVFDNMCIKNMKLCFVILCIGFRVISLLVYANFFTVTP